jgi:hypothetical protein
MRIAYSILTTVFLLMSRSTGNRSYNRNAIIKRYNAAYRIHLDTVPINSEDYYLDKDNISAFLLNKRDKSIYKSAIL